MKKVVVSNSDKIEETAIVDSGVTTKSFKEKTPKKTVAKLNPINKKIVKEITIGANDGEGNFELLEDSEFFRTTKGKFTSRFAKSLKEKELVKLSSDDHDVTLGFIGKRSNIKKIIRTKGKVLSSDKERSSIIFENFEEGLDLNYEVHSQGVKESIIVRERQDDYTFDFTMNIGNLTPKYNEETRCIELCENDEVIYRILSPFMQDAKGEISNDCSYEIEQDGEVLNLTLKADKEWINSNERVLPVVIDPSIDIVANEVATFVQYGDMSKYSFPSNTFVIGVDSGTSGSTWWPRVTLNRQKLLEKAENIEKIYLTFAFKSFSSPYNSSDTVQVIYNDKSYASVKFSEIKDKMTLDITELVMSTTGTSITFDVITKRSYPGSLSYVCVDDFKSGNGPEFIVDYIPKEDNSVIIDTENYASFAQVGDTSIYSFPKNTFIIGIDTGSRGPSWWTRVTLDKRKLLASIPNFRRIKLSYVFHSFSSPVTMSDTIQVVYNEKTYSDVMFSEVEKKAIIDITEVILQSTDNTIVFDIESKRDYPGSMSYLCLHNFNSVSANKPKFIVDFLPKIDDIGKDDNPGKEEETPDTEYDYSDETVEKVSEKEYTVGRAGTTLINLKTGSFRHVHNIAGIAHNNLTADVTHVFDSEVYDGSKNEFAPAYMGKGWKTNLHQFLVKSKHFNKSSESRVVTYFDDKGEKHIFHNKWYYKDENGTQHFIDKAKVLFDVDSKLKYQDDNGNIFDVEFETKSDENYTLLSAGDLYNYHKRENMKIQARKFLIYFANDVEEEIKFVSDKSKKVAYPRFYYIDDNNTNKKRYISSENVINKDGILYTIVNKAVRSVFISNCEDYLQLEDNKLSVRYSVSEITNEIKEIYQPIYMIIDRKIDADEKIYDFYKNEEIVNIEQQIQSAIQYLKSYESQSENVAHTLFLYEKDKANQESLELLRKKLKNLRDLSTDSDGEKEYNTLSDELEEKSNTFSKENNALQQLWTETSYIEILNNLYELINKLELLKEQKEYLIEKQKQQVSDFIIDKDGNSLGFDGYGRLVVIQDNLENKIKIEYGRANEEKDKILYISSEQQIIKFNYDEDTGFLKSIIDPRGRKTKFEYNENNELTGIKYNDCKKTILDYCECFSVTSPRLESTKVIKNEVDGSINVKTYCLKTTYDEESGIYQNVIDKDTKLLGNEETENIINHHFTFDSEHKSTIITDEYTQEKATYFFNSTGRIVKQEGVKSTKVMFYEDKLLLSEVEYKNYDEEKSEEDNPVLEHLTIYSSSHTYKYDLSEFDLPTSNMLGLRINTFAIDKNITLSFKIKATVITYKNNELKKEVFEQEFEEIALQTIVLPICIDRNNSTNLDVEITNNSSNFNSSNVKSIDLIKLESGVICTYDEDEHLIKKQDGYNTTIYEEFNDEDVSLKVTKSDIFGKEVTTIYSYNSDNQLMSFEDSKGNVEEYYYNDKGQCVEKRSYNKKDASLMNVETTEYDDQGRVLSSKGSIKDPNGNYPIEEVSYLPNTNIKSKVKEVNGETTCYSYDTNTGDLLSISSSTSGINNSTVFTYNYGLLTSISHHGMKVEYTYDGKGRKTIIKLNGEKFLWNVYKDHIDEEDDVSCTSYAKSTNLSGYSVESFMDKDDHVILTRFSADDSIGETTYTYEDNKLINSKTKIAFATINDFDKPGSAIRYTYFETIKNTYNDFDAIINQEKYVDDSLQVATKINYDIYNQFVTSVDVILPEIGNDGYRVNYLNCFDDEQRLKSVNIRKGNIDNETNFDEIEMNTFEYDSLGRVSHNIIDTSNMSICHEYSYLQQDENSLDLITEDILRIKVKNSGNVTYLTETATYSYDVSGNITSIQQDDKKTRYFYDSLNRLIREDNPFLNQTVFYKYDKAGNILQKRIHAYNTTLEEVQTSAKTINDYTYSCEGWRDQLIDFDGKKISYDEMGRPTKYKDLNLKWNNKSELKFANDGKKYCEFLYDSKGVRRMKVVNGGVTSYVTSGTQILSSVSGWGEKKKIIIFRYVLDKLVGFNYNEGNTSKEYIYVRNIQGDITGIYDGEGNYVGGYAYDAWGNHKVLDAEGNEDNSLNSICNINPFRYRGYYFDVETGLYYCNSRYYDPETGRWISPDTISILDETMGQINGLNLYMYCGDNPIMRKDPSGYLFITLSAFLIGLAAGAIIGAVSGAVYGGINAAANGQNILAGIGIGFIAGAFMGAGAGVASAFIIAGGLVSVSIGAAIAFTTGAIGGIGGDALNQLVNYGYIKDPESLLWSGLEYGFLNTINAFTCALGGDLGFVDSLAINFPFGFVYGGIGLTIDLLRSIFSENAEHKAKTNSNTLAFI